MKQSENSKQKFHAMRPVLDERARRVAAATEALSLGYGGVSLMSRASGLSRQTITQGIHEIKAGLSDLSGHVRRPGAGRKSITVSDPKILSSLEEIIDCQTRGDPQSPLRWICKSTRAIALALSKKRHPVSHTKVAQLLHELNYSLQGNRKTAEGEYPPDHDAQFRHINAAVKTCLAQNIPVISVGTKKKELIWNYINDGQQWLPAKEPVKFQEHDFSNLEVHRAYPYGIYDLGSNPGFVNLGTDHDTGEFTVASICGWWRAEGIKLYPKTKEILITADGGGSNGSQLRFWEFELQKLADQTGLSISVCHFPPGTSKWNNIEHRLFSFITSNWRGETLRDYETIVKLIANTTTAKELKVKCRLDRRKYPVGQRISDEEMKLINMERKRFHSEWNYTIKPKTLRV
jgi:hypothetical protein